MRNTFPAWGALAILAMSPPARGAELTLDAGSALVPGNRVRLHSAAYSRPLTGRVQSVEEQSVVLEVDDRMVLRVPVESLQRAEVSIARRRQWVRGALIGAVIGLPLGVTADVDPTWCGPGSTAFCSRGEAVAAMTLTSAGIGALIGRFARADDWTEVRLPRVSLAPEPRGARVALSWRF